jgi:hypothetical protein
MFATFNKWVGNFDHRPGEVGSLITINPLDVVSVVDTCGPMRPGSAITLRNKEVFLVNGLHIDIVNTLRAARGQA